MPSKNENPAENNRPTIEAKVDFLSRPSNYPYSTSGVEVKETHMSWVFLTDRHAYKLKKPVRYNHLDLSTVKARAENCRTEVELNRRLAKEVYLGFVPLSINRKGVMQLEKKNEVVDWLVKMKRIPEQRMLDYQIAHDAVEEDGLEEAAKRLAVFYMNASPVDFAPGDYLHRMQSDLEFYFQELSSFREAFPEELLWETKNQQLNFLRKNASLFEERVRQKKIVEGHGDLRPEHICLTDPPAIIDCLEFDRELRILDPVDDLCLLFIECEVKGVRKVGARFLEIYLEVSGDRIPESMIFYYKSFRAVIRALLSIRHISEARYQGDPKWISKANNYLKLACRHAGMFVN